MKFEEALVELRKGKTISINGCDSLSLSNFVFMFGTYDIFTGVKDSILSDKWEVLEEPGKTFDQVFEDFKNGKKIRRTSWHVNVYCDNTMGRYFICDDILATDWEVNS